MENKLIGKLIEQQETIKAMQENEDSAIKIMEMYKECKKRIDKAIDFLKKNACIDEDVEYFCDDLRYDDCKKLLEILKGEDKE